MEVQEQVACQKNDVIQAISANMVEHYQCVLERLPAGIIVISSKGYIEQANPQAFKLLGEPLIGENWSTIIAREIINNPNNNSELECRSGHIVTIATQSLNKIPGQLILINDVTEYCQMQSRLNHIERLSSMGKMSAQLAHQIRTPLASALLYAKNAMAANLSESKRSKFLSRISESLHQIEAQIKDMLAFSRGNTVKFETMPVKQLFTYLQVAIKQQIEDQDMQLLFESEAIQGNITVNKDALLGAIQNCINNAVEASNNSANIIIKIIPNENEFLDLIVLDDGPGISAEIIQKVTESFFTTRSKGTGLGLAVAKLVAESHGGHLWLTSEPNIKTEIGFRLPFKKENNNG